MWLNGALVSSLCRTQGLIALSSPEAEYHACTVGVAEAKFVQSILFDWNESAEIELFVDNISAITLGRRIGLSGMRHMETRYLWIQEELRGQRLKLTKVEGTENAANVATKHVDTATLQKCMKTIGLINQTRILSAVLMVVNSKLEKIVRHSTNRGHVHHRCEEGFGACQIRWNSS